MLSAHLQLTRFRQSRYWLRLPDPLPAQRPAPRNTSSLAISLSLFSSASSSVYRPIKVIITVPWCRSQLRNQNCAETRVSISHHNRFLVHTYVQGNTTPLGIDLPNLEEKRVPNLKLSR